MQVFTTKNKTISKHRWLHAFASFQFPVHKLQSIKAAEPENLSVTTPDERNGLGGAGCGGVSWLCS